MGGCGENTLHSVGCLSFPDLDTYCCLKKDLLGKHLLGDSLSFCLMTAATTLRNKRSGNQNENFNNPKVLKNVFKIISNIKNSEAML